MIENWSEAVIAISNLSAIAGEASAIADGGRMLFWQGEEDYWMHLVICDEGLPHVLVIDHFAPAKEMMGVIGYCAYSGTHIEMDTDVDKEDKDDDV